MSHGKLRRWAYGRRWSAQILLAGMFRRIPGKYGVPRAVLSDVLRAQGISVSHILALSCVSPLVDNLIEQEIYQIDFLAPPLRRLSSPLDPSHIFICSILSSAGRHTPFWKQRRWASKVGKAKINSAGGHISVAGIPNNEKSAFDTRRQRTSRVGPVHRLSVLV